MSAGRELHASPSVEESPSLATEATSPVSQNWAQTIFYFLLWMDTTSVFSSAMAHTENSVWFGPEPKFSSERPEASLMLFLLLKDPLSFCSMHMNSPMFGNSHWLLKLKSSQTKWSQLSLFTKIFVFSSSPVEFHHHSRCEDLSIRLAYSLNSYTI